MSEIREDLRYTENHEWVKIDGTSATVGITDYAQDTLGEIVYVELPEIDAALAQGDEAASIESVKAAAPVYAPIGGTVTGINEDLEDAPEQINSTPYESHIFTLKMDDPADADGLMDADTYAEFVQSSE